MTTLVMILLVGALWAYSIGKNFATVKNYNMNILWYLPAFFGGPFTALALLAIVSSSDEMKTRRKLRQMKVDHKLLEAKIAEEKVVTKYLEYHD